MVKLTVIGPVDQRPKPLLRTLLGDVLRRARHVVTENQRVLAAAGLAWFMYGRVPVPAVAPRGRPLTVAARKDLYGDAFNESVLMRPGQWLTRLSVYFDNRGVDGLVNTLAAAVGGTSGRVRKLQTGFVRSYALSMFFGAAVLVALLLVVRL